MKWYNNIKEKYNKLFNSPRKKAILKLSIGIIFFTLAIISLSYDKESDIINTDNTYSYETTLDLINDKTNVIEALETYIDDSYAFSYENEIESCLGKVYSSKYYIVCGTKKYYYDGSNIKYYLNNNIVNEEVDTTKYFYNINDLKALTYIKNEINFDGSKTYYYQKDSITTNITFYKQDLLKIEDKNATYIFKDYGSIKEKDVIEDFE